MIISDLEAVYDTLRIIIILRKMCTFCMIFHSPEFARHSWRENCLFACNLLYPQEACKGVLYSITLTSLQLPLIEVGNAMKAVFYSIASYPQTFFAAFLDCSNRRHVRLHCLLGTPCEVSPSAATEGTSECAGTFWGQEKLIYLLLRLQKVIAPLANRQHAFLDFSRILCTRQES